MYEKMDYYRDLMKVQQERIAACDKELDELTKRLSAVRSDKSNWNRELRNTQKEMDEYREQQDKNYVANNRRKAKKIAAQYGIEIEDDSYREAGEYNLLHYVGPPDWIKGDDPLEDGHYAYHWEETLWLVEFYAKWHPDHPEHDQRTKEGISPWN